jgi:30S ribosomal protein S31
MGKGDRRSRKGKIWRGSHGKTRPRKPSAAAFVPKVKKAASKKEEVSEETAAPKEAKPKKAPAAKKAAAPKKAKKSEE